MLKSKLINLKVSYTSKFSCKNLVLGMCTFVLDNSLQTTIGQLCNVCTRYLQYSAVIFCVHMRFIAISWSLTLVKCSSATLSFSIAHKFSTELRFGLLPGQCNVLIFFSLKKSHSLTLNSDREHRLA